MFIQYVGNSLGPWIRQALFFLPNSSGSELKNQAVFYHRWIGYFESGHAGLVPAFLDMNEIEFSASLFEYLMTGANNLNLGSARNLFMNGAATLLSSLSYDLLRFLHDLLFLRFFRPVL